jgi:hypothetical protein
MDFNYFIQLSAKKQEKEIYLFAEKAAYRRDEKYEYVLYQLHSFYIETKQGYPYNNDIEIKAFTADAVELDAYLDEIKEIELLSD